MDRLLLLKAAVVEYFRVHASDKRRLSVREWSVTSEVCSVLDPVAEVNTKIQGAEDTYISQATFLMTELLAIMGSGPFCTRTPDKPQVDPVPYDDVETSDLCGEVRTAVGVCVEYMGKKNLGEVGNPVERISTLLDPRRKTLSKQECVNGSPDVKQLVINELEDVADLIEGSAPQQTTVPAASASAPAPAPASALVPRLPLLQPLVATGRRGHWQRSRGCSPLWSSDAPTHWLPLGVRVPLKMRRRATRGQASRTRSAFSKS